MLPDHVEELVVERPEEISEAIESVFVDVGVLAPFGLSQTLEGRLGVERAFQARESFRGIEHEVLFRNYSPKT